MCNDELLLGCLERISPATHYCTLGGVLLPTSSLWFLTSLPFLSLMHHQGRRDPYAPPVYMDTSKSNKLMRPFLFTIYYVLLLHTQARCSPFLGGQISQEKVLSLASTSTNTFNKRRKDGSSKGQVSLLSSGTHWRLLNLLWSAGVASPWTSHVSWMQFIAQIVL